MNPELQLAPEDTLYERELVEGPVTVLLVEEGESAPEIPASPETGGELRMEIPTPPALATIEQSLTIIDQPDPPAEWLKAVAEQQLEVYLSTITASSADTPVLSLSREVQHAANIEAQARLQ